MLSSAFFLFLLTLFFHLYLVFSFRFTVNAHLFPDPYKFIEHHNLDCTVTVFDIVRRLALVRMMVDLHPEAHVDQLMYLNFKFLYYYFCGIKKKKKTFDKTYALDMELRCQSDKVLC